MMTPPRKPIGPLHRFELESDCYECSEFGLPTVSSKNISVNQYDYEPDDEFDAPILQQGKKYRVVVLIQEIE